MKYIFKKDEVECIQFDDPERAAFIWCDAKGSAKRMTFGSCDIDIGSTNTLHTHYHEEEFMFVYKGKGPALIECKTYRFLGHSITDNRPYRTCEEENEWKTKDPITSFRKRLIAQDILSLEEIKELEDVVRLEIKEAVEFARQSPEPSVEDAEKYLFV